MDLIKHNAQGATIHLNEWELVIAMALIQEGRDSFECQGKTGKALDNLFSTAVALVDQARQSALQPQTREEPAPIKTAPATAATFEDRTAAGGR